MKFSEAWLREFVDPDISTDELVEQLTMAGLEVDAVEPVAAEFTGVVVGEVLEVSPHPDADKLVVCRVSAGSEELQVVCGAPNVRAGLKVPFARVGANLEDFQIKKAKLRGVESHGMLCSERELGISDRHEGLMELPPDAPVGDDIRDYLKLDDSVIDLDLTPNRSDCLGLLGLGREAGIIGKLDVNALEIPEHKATIDDTFPVELAAPEGCSRFAGRVIRGINLDAETPLWMKEKLRRSGIRSIDPVVDVTNYVMMELGQPMHAYDFDKLAGKIVVRQSKEGESVTLLDGQDIKLKANTLLITDNSGPIGIAGIMGGLTTAVTDQTANIFLESAFFAPTAIAGRARSYGMHTDASHRFERGVDWQGQSRAVERATQLLLEIAGGDAGPVTEAVAEQGLPPTQEVLLRSSRVARLIGVEIDPADIDRMLEQLHFDAVRTDGDDVSWKVTAPSHRFDIQIEADLIEEISRIYGYNTIPVRTPVTNLTMVGAPEGELTVNRIKDELVARGYHEAITYSFVDMKSEQVLDPENEPIGIANPLSSEMGVMRTTLWSGLLKSLIYNLNRQQSRVRLFETGLRFRRNPNQPELTMDDIHQEMMVAGVACGPRHPENWANSGDAIDFFDIKGDVEAILSLTGVEGDFTFEAATHPALHPGQTAKVQRGDQLVGYIGLMDPRARRELDIDVPVYLFEFNVAALSNRLTPAATELSRFPEVRRDIAILVSASISAGLIRECIEQTQDVRFKGLRIFDVYQGPGIEPDQKSVALGLTFQHPSETLTDEDVNDAVEKIMKALSEQLGAVQR